MDSSGGGGSGYIARGVQGGKTLNGMPGNNYGDSKAHKPTDLINHPLIDNAGNPDQDGLVLIGYDCPDCTPFPSPSPIAEASPTPTPSPISRENTKVVLSSSNVGDMSYMFNGCTSLVELNATDWDTSAVTNMSDMFSGMFIFKVC